jgi:flagellar biogenesis protein FliO
MAGPESEFQGGFAAQLLDWLRRTFRQGLTGTRKARRERRLELVEALPLGGRRQLLLVLCDGQRVLVGAGADSVQSIVEMKDPVAMGGAVCGMNEGLRMTRKARCN